ncbi:MAG TPA: AAA family ATPase [Candidatus Binatia bacterium]|jgi:general secretion pathway protein A|nr:AAA family ATPase [Candidatus Binatia bacterium]
MYDKYFGFRESPFSVTPDPRFFYTNTLYQEAFATLHYGIEAKKGFIVITGEAGTGKTTLLRKLMRNLEATTHSVFIFNTQLNFTELLQLILRGLDLEPQEDNGLAMTEGLNRYLIEQFKQQRVVSVLIDEAQNLSDETLEGLRLLTNLETDKEKLLQIVLMGQPELEAKLDQPALRQLKQRVVLHCRLAPLKDNEVGPYIDFRLRIAGYEGEPLFDAVAVQRIALYSGGIPRLINTICDNALLIAYASGQKRVAADMIKETADDLQLRAKSDMVHIDDSLVETPAANPKPNFFQKAPPNQSKSSAWVRAGMLWAVFFLTAGTALSVLNLNNLVGFFSEHPKARAGFELLLQPAEATGEPKLTTKTLLGDQEPRRLAISLETDSTKLQRLKPGLTPLNAERFQPKHREIERRERQSSLGNYDVVRGSFVRNMPRSDAEIIATLQPHTQVKVLSRIGNYFKVHSIDDGSIRGYVHQEDAFFVLSKDSH